MALAQMSWGQRASNWRAYKVADGLPDPACSSITIGPHGKVWVKHFDLESISLLDGYTVQTIPLPNAGNNRIYESLGGQLWTTTLDGLAEYRESNWLHYPVREIAAEFHTNILRQSPPVPLCPVRQGRVLFLLPDALMEFVAEDQKPQQTAVLRPAIETKLGKFLDMTIARDGGLWVAGTHGVARVPGPARSIKAETEWQEHLLPESLQVQNLQEPREDEEGGITAIAEGLDGQQKLIVHFNGQQWVRQSNGNDKLRLAWRGPDKSYWGATLGSLVQFEEGREEAVENEEVSARKYFDAAVEPGGAFWLATSDGLFRHAPRIWQIPNSLGKINSLIHSLGEDQERRLWIVAGNALHSLAEDQASEYVFPAALSRSLQTTYALFSLPSGALVLGTEDGLFQFQPGKREFSRVPTDNNTGQSKLLGLLKDGTVAVELSSRESMEEPGRLEIYDGKGFRHFPLPEPEAALGKEFSALFAEQNGNVWLSGNRGMGWYHDSKWQTFTATDGTVPLGAGCFVELADGKIWCATQDKVWEFNGRIWSVVRAGFERINALLRSRDGTMWVASDGGLYRFSQDAWVENGMEEGLASGAVRQIYEDHRGHIWAGTARGLCLLHAEADPDPPQTYIQNLNEKGNNVPEGTPITLAFSGLDKWKSTPRDRLLFSTRLDGHDWSSFQEKRSASFDDLAAGKHYFQVRAMDRNCNVDPNPARLEFAMTVPWYRESPLLLSSALAVTIFFAGLAFNRHRQLLRSYAAVEQKVAERTRELEIANRELLHSQKMNALGTLAAGIAHDFNNILSIIKGSAQIIEDNLDNTQKIQTRLDRIKTVVEQGAGIVKAMLGFSRSSDQKPGLCDLNEIAEETIKLLGDRFLREVEVRFEGAANLPKVLASQDFIQQILLNFIFNAAEAMTGRREVILTTGSMSKPPAGIALVPAEAAAYVFMAVKDQGCGIPPENMSRIFEPFFTTKAMSARRGTGLGLSMAYELAKKLQAGLSVESALNEGSTFTLILPVRELPADVKP
ncbi:MAG: Histidine kinase [Pedosphaera sp.]|nr:Histidine kinase [Pedosphaera sp.]